MFFEPKRRYWDKGEVLADGRPRRSTLHAARVVRLGTDVTLVAYGPTVRTCLDAAAAAEVEGRSLEVIDLRSLSPLDLDTLLASRGAHRAARRRP